MAGYQSSARRRWLHDELLDGGIDAIAGLQPSLAGAGDDGLDDTSARGHALQQERDRASGRAAQAAGEQSLLLASLGVVHVTRSPGLTVENLQPRLRRVGGQPSWHGRRYHQPEPWWIGSLSLAA